ncbi:MAG: hypothetical protein KF878_28320 [Planctomycetes bacterium]|nr:hypothetical protein [Planctomycetota bacterium]MCW8141942.1 hypothetical protein [Planctomycetota bacterium]
MSDERGDATPAPTPGTSCCPMRRKVVVGILGVLGEAQCGVPDSELADFLRFDLQTPDGKPVLAFRYCPWCGQQRAAEAEVRIVDVRVEPGPDASGEFEPPGDFEPPPSGEGPTWDPPREFDPPPDGEGWK